jgi:hypothetical protein
MNETWTWLTLALLGAYHGINPAMGWLFAVALGLQERSRTAVLHAFLPIVLGHAVSVGVVVALVVAAQELVAPQVLGLLSGSALVAVGLSKLLARAAHPRWVGMRVGFRDLTAWSLLMSTAHGAGLMLAPVLLRLPSSGMDHTAHAAHAQQMQPMLLASTAAGMSSGSLAAVLIHTAAMFVTMAVVAIIVYEKVGLAILRRAWLNLDLVWAGALVVAGAITIIMG